MTHEFICTKQLKSVGCEYTVTAPSGFLLEMDTEQLHEVFGVETYPSMSHDKKSILFSESCGDEGHDEVFNNEDWTDLLGKYLVEDKNT